MSLSRCLILIAWGIGLSILLGLFKGMLDAFFHKGRTGFSTLSGIVLYSIPDVLIAFVSLVAVVYLSKVSWVNRLVDANTLRLYIMPILSLTIVPIIYISRLVFVALEEEKKKDYVKFLHYKGLSKLQIYVGHFSKVALVKILDSSKAVIMLIFSNLIVVEYLFNYPGIMYNLLESSEDSTKVIILSLSIGLSFISIYLLSVLLLKLIHPGRRVR
jgi:ABC-type dipeptide/oligopeptide/nickel transport system permease component